MESTTIVEKELQKCPTGIQGLDEITFGGLPLGRPTLLSGNAGCGKTLMAMEFLVRGAKVYNEPGAFLSFEETSNDLITNFASLGFGLSKLIKSKKLIIDYVHIERSEIEETGEYDLEGLFLRLANAIDSIGAKRVVLDTLEALFSGFTNESILRAELRRLFRWIKDKGVTAIITGEKGEGMITKYGLEEYVADCVILLDHLVTDQIATRRIRIVKYRGSSHGSNEFPFLISETGISVLPITSIGLDYKVTSERISTGIKGLDEMFGNKGFFLRSTILVSGGAGTGKTSFAAHFIDSACRQGRTCVCFAFEESQDQILRNMKSIGFDLQQWIDKGLLKYSANRPSHFGVEMHLLHIHNVISQIKPDIVVIDSITNLLVSAVKLDVHLMLTRLLDHMKMLKITSFLTDLITDTTFNYSEVGISSLVDTWIKLGNIQKDNLLKRKAFIIKSRGIGHSNAIHDFNITEKGVEILNNTSQK